MQEGEEEHIYTPLFMKKWMPRDPHENRHSSDRPFRARHLCDHSLRALHSLFHARDGSSATPSFFFPLLILVRYNDMLYMYKVTSIIMRNV